MNKQIDDQIIQDIQAALEAMYESIREEGKAWTDRTDKNGKEGKKIVEDMILAVEDQILEATRSINLVIHTRDKLEHLQDRIDSYMGDEVVNLDPCKEALEKVQNGLVNDLCAMISEALEQLEEEEKAIIEDYQPLDIPEKESEAEED